VLEGLKEGDVVVTAQVNAPNASPPSANPFAGAPPRRF
jgi:hypothetical protein